MKIKIDTNGNRCLKIESSDIGARGFSIQTMGNLRETHRNGIGAYTINEVRDYIAEYGTPRQKILFGIK